MHLISQQHYYQLMYIGNHPILQNTKSSFCVTDSQLMWSHHYIRHWNVFKRSGYWFQNICRIIILLSQSQVCIHSDFCARGLENVDCGIICEVTLEFWYLLAHGLLLITTSQKFAIRTWVNEHIVVERWLHWQIVTKVYSALNQEHCSWSKSKW